MANRTNVHSMKRAEAFKAMEWLKANDATLRQEKDLTDVKVAKRLNRELGLKCNEVNVRNMRVDLGLPAYRPATGAGSFSQAGIKQRVDALEKFVQTVHAGVVNLYKAVDATIPEDFEVNPFYREPSFGERLQEISKSWDSVPPK